jgi:hypothetical protein
VTGTFIELRKIAPLRYSAPFMKVWLSFVGADIPLLIDRLSKILFFIFLPLAAGHCSYDEKWFVSPDHGVRQRNVR